MPRPSDLHVLGMGNLLYRDEGVGVYAVRYLQRAFRFVPEIDLEDGASLGFGVIDYFEDGSRLLVLDALQTSAPPGTIFRLPEQALLRLSPSLQPTAHEIDPVQHLRLATALGKQVQMTLLGIVPADASEMAVGLTPQLQAAFPHFVDAALAELRAMGVDSQPAEQLSLDEVIRGLVSRTR